MPERCRVLDEDNGEGLRKRTTKKSHSRCVHLSIAPPRPWGSRGGRYARGASVSYFFLFPKEPEERATTCSGISSGKIITAVAGTTRTGALKLVFFLPWRPATAALQ
jgi:hypothetical protein